MSANRVFFDTNVLIYTADSSSPAKQAEARRRLEAASLGGTGVVSVQVLGEFFQVSVVRRALLKPAEAEIIMRGFVTFQIEPVDENLVRDAVQMHLRFGANYWDSLILATAKRAGCGTLLSEDFNTGEDYDGVRVVNPFASG